MAEFIIFLSKQSYWQITKTTFVLRFVWHMAPFYHPSFMDLYDQPWRFPRYFSKWRIWLLFPFFDYDLISIYPMIEQKNDNWINISTDDSKQNHWFVHLCYEMTYIDWLVADFREMLCHFYLLAQTDTGLSFPKRYYMTL